MRLVKKLILVSVVASFALAGLPGCEKKGPAEKAGEQMDKATEKAKDAVK